VPELKRFVEAGGALLAIGSSIVIGQHLGLPIRDVLTERVVFIPGSILEARVDNTHPLAFGLGRNVDIFFDHSEAFRLLPEAGSRGVRAVAWIDNPAPLRSGWAWGQHYLDQAVEILEAPVGKGRLVGT
jgi:hypothetical protein